MDWIVSNIDKYHLTIWLGAICTLAIYSLLYKENPYYRLFEHIFIGLAMGQLIYITVTEILGPMWWEPMINQGQWWWSLALVAGAMFYFVYSKRNAWISRFIFGALMGNTAGMVFQDFANQYLPMVKGSFKPVVPAPGVPATTAIDNLIFALVLISVMAYFFFSIDHKARAVKHTASLGRWCLMFAFGATFGSTVMARMSLLIGRMDYLIRDWSPIVPGWLWIAFGLIIIALVVLALIKLGNPPPKGKDSIPEEPQAAVAEGKG